MQHSKGAGSSGGHGRSGSGGSGDGRSSSPSHQWISAEKASDLALQVMLQDGSEADKKKPVQLCTHGRGRPVYGQYLGTAHD